MSPGATNVARSPSTSRSAGASQATTGVPQASASTAGSPKPSSLGGEHERVRAAVDRRQLLVGDLAREDHVGQLVRPRAGRADQHQRQLARRRRRAWRRACAGRGGAGRRPTRGSARAGRSARAPRRSPARRAGTSPRRPPRGSRRPARASRRRCATASRATASVGTITRAARCTARWRRRRRRPPRRCSLRRLSAARSWSVTTIGQGLRSIAPSIHGE